MRGNAQRPSKSWVSLLLVCGALLLLTLPYAIIKYPEQHTSPHDIMIDIAIAAGLCVCFLGPALGTYFVLQDGEFFLTQYFIFRKYIAVEDVIELKYLPTFIAGNSHRTLFLYTYDYGRKDEFVGPSYPVFTREAIAQIVRELLSMNPRIGLDSHTEELLDETAKK
jgi:hypothetical protein